MLNRMVRTAAVCAGLLAGFALPTLAGHHTPIEAAVNDNPYRMEGESARDAARHPAEFLTFVGITPEMAVAEINPGGGWYSRILGPLLREKGRFVGLEHHPDFYEGTNYGARLAQYPAKLEAARDMYGPKAVAAFFPAPDGLPVEAQSLDAVLVVRAMHNWLERDFFDAGMDQTWAMLKPGGVLGVVQHRADEDASEDRLALAKRGRWKQADLIAHIEAHGFKLVATSEMNANPKDTKDYPEGVWTLPPSFELGDKDRAKYEAIGESDRMTLKFVKVGNF